MVKHRHDGEEWWCLPGGGIMEGETPEEAVLRELKEECRVDGHLIKGTSVVDYGVGEQHFTFFVEIGNQKPVLGDDPDKEEGKKILADIQWMALSDLSEADRVYLWTAGLLTIPAFTTEILSWDRTPSSPAKKKET